jgi:hypothetical protein
MSKFGITAFKEAIAKTGGLAGGHLFKFNLTFSANTTGVLDIKNNSFGKVRELLCKSVTVPADQIESTTLHHFGREVSIPGARKFPPFTATFWNSADYNTRYLFSEWLSLLSSHTTNERGVIDVTGVRRDSLSRLGHLDYVATITLEHFSKESIDPKFPQSIPIIGQLFDSGKVKRLATYKLYNAFPTSVTNPAFSVDSDEFQTYDVEFHYQSMTMTIDK